MGFIDELKSDLKEAVERVCPELKEENTALQKQIEELKKQIEDLKKEINGNK